jgi:glutamate racemase
MTIIGVFDSGVGGLSVLRHLRVQAPAAHLIYFADSAHVPYGPRPLTQIQSFSEAITRFLLAQGAEAIVVACNTASAAALKTLRGTFSAVPFVGMEPAVKPAAENTRTGVVGVLATPATFQGELFNSVVERFAQGVTVLQQICPGLVEQIEAGELATPKTEGMLRGWVEPLLAQNIDALVLGCTHYPFVIPLLQKICGPSVRIIDPAPAVARQTLKVLSAPPIGAGETAYWTSGPLVSFKRTQKRLGSELGMVRAAQWLNETWVEPAGRTKKLAAHFK